MANQNVLTDTKYQKLVKDIQQLLEEGRSTAERIVREEALKTYWQVGQRLVEEGLTGQENYGQAILEDIAEETAVDVSTLQRCIAFFKDYKAAPRGGNLSWTHYKHLLPLKDPEKRTFYETKAEEGAWTVRELEGSIKKGEYETKQSPAKAKAAETLPRPTGNSYIFPAKLERVVDGDTVIFRLDLGFEVWKEQRVRLAEIDAPAISDPGGKETARHIREVLGRAAVIMVKTNRFDMYARYLGHVFYSYEDQNKDTVFQKGHYLNEELVRKKLVQRV